MKTIEEIVTTQLGMLVMQLLQKDALLEKLQEENKKLQEELNGKHSS